MTTGRPELAVLRFSSTPVGNNTNQILNPLLNLTQMNNGTLVAGYIIETNGIQLGLTSSNTGYAYTSLNPTGLRLHQFPARLADPDGADRY